MGRQRFTPELKEGAVRQVIERGQGIGILTGLFSSADK